MSLAGDDIDKICDIVDKIIVEDAKQYLDEYSMKDIKYTCNMLVESILDSIKEHYYYYGDELANCIAKKIHDEEGEEIDGYEG